MEIQELISSPSFLGTIVEEAGTGTPAVMFLGCFDPEHTDLLSNGKLNVKMTLGLRKTKLASVVRVTLHIENETIQADMNQFLDVEDSKSLNMLDILLKTGYYYFSVMSSGSVTGRCKILRSKLPSQFVGELESLLRNAKRHNKQLNRMDFDAAVREVVGN